MKKIVPALLAFVLTALAFNAQAPGPAGCEQKGSLKFEAYRDMDFYIMTLSMNQAKPVTREVMAVKVVFQPSETVVFLLTSENLSKEDADAFLNGASPLARMSSGEIDENGKVKPDSSLVEPFGKYQATFPVSIMKDKKMEVFFLVKREGKLQSQFVSRADITNVYNFGMQSYYSLR